MEDNAACIAQANTGMFRRLKAAKHYGVRLRFLQQMVVDKHVTFEYCPTASQLADFLTRPLDLVTFVRFRDVIMHQHS